MRTTVEITDEQRARLLELAARRGAKGFSSLVQEALERYLEQEARGDEQRRTALAARGRLSQKEASALEQRVQALRKAWR